MIIISKDLKVDATLPFFSVLMIFLSKVNFGSMPENILKVMYLSLFSYINNKWNYFKGRRAVHG